MYQGEAIKLFSMKFQDGGSLKPEIPFNTTMGWAISSRCLVNVEVTWGNILWFCIRAPGIIYGRDGQLASRGRHLAYIYNWPTLHSKLIFKNVKC